MKYLKFGPAIRTPVVAATGVGVGLGLAWIAALLGARQAEEYEFAMTEVSGLGFAFWLFILALLSLQGKSFLRAHSFEVGMIAFYLGTYWLIEVTARIFESSLLLVLLAGLALSGWKRVVFWMAVILVQLVLNWLYRLGQPALGFGLG